MSGLTEEQRRRMEENKRKALEKRAKAHSSQGAPSSSSLIRPAASSGTRPVSSSLIRPVSGTGTKPVSSSLIRPVSSSNPNSVCGTSHGIQNSTATKASLETSSNSSSIIRPVSGTNNQSTSTNRTGLGSSNSAQNRPPSSSLIRPVSSLNSLPKGQSSVSNQSSSVQAGSSGNTFYSSGPSSTTGIKPQGNGKSNTNWLSSYQQKSQVQSQGAGSPSKVVNQAFDKASKSGAKTSGACVLISKSRFEINVKYHKKLVEVFQTMSTRRYNSETRNWSFHLKEYRALIQKMGDLRTELNIEPLPRSLLQMFKKYVRSDTPDHEEAELPDVDLSDVDETLVETLLPFQRHAINFAVHHGGRVLIADDMGLGKTLQALCVACYYRREWPLLIVVPSSVRFQWREQIWQWLKSVDRPDINVALKGTDDCKQGLVTIISYDLMVRKSKELLDRGFRVVIFDESHFLKSYTSKRTKEAVPIIKNATRAILLSGTPALSRPKELFSQLNALDHRSFPKFQDFGLRYCDGKKLPYGWDYNGSSNMAELELLLKERIMIRRLKRDVIKQLPGKRRQTVLLDPSSVKINKGMKSSHHQVGQAKGSDRRGMLLQYFNETATVKIPAVKQYMMDQLEAGHKFLLFAHHQEMLNALEEAASKSYKYIRIDGATSAQARNDMCTRFQNDHQVTLALLSITAANAGLNMTAASLVIFGELFWNPGILVQAEDRVHRIGQEDSVNVHYLVAQGTADDYIWPLVQRKLDVLCRAGLSKDDFSEADTTQLKDPRHKDIASYFPDSTQPDVMTCFEESFFDDDASIVTSQEDAAVARKLSGPGSSDDDSSCSEEEDSVVLEAPSGGEIQPSHVTKAEHVISAEHVIWLRRVYFDVETTGLGCDSDITQLSAVSEDSTGKAYVYDRYVKPVSGRIRKGASAVTGLRMRRGHMYYKGKKVNAIPLHEALQGFTRWLRYLDKPLLFAHNCRTFDSRVLWTAMDKCDMTKTFCDHVTGFVDTLPMSREMLPSRRSYSQSDLVDDLLNAPYSAHNSLADSKVLKKLVEHLKPSNELVAKHSFSIQEVAIAMATRVVKLKYVETLEPLVESDIVTKYMADKMAASGIDYKTLEGAFREERRQGIKSLLGGAGDAEKSSVTKQNKVIDSLAEYFGNILELDFKK